MPQFTEIFSYFLLSSDIEVIDWYYYDYDTGDYCIIRLWMFTIHYTNNIR